jgi:hypothetical protein
MYKYDFAMQNVHNGTFCRKNLLIRQTFNKIQQKVTVNKAYLSWTDSFCYNTAQDSMVIFFSQ